MERHLILVPPLEEQAPQQVVTLVPVRVRALAQELGLALRLALDLEQELQQGLEQGLVLPQELVEDLVLEKVEAQELVSVLARVAVLGLILEQE
jgi:hypothetical protein